MRLRRVMMCRVMIAAPARFDMQAAQPKKPRLRTRHHLVERGFCRGAILRALRGLRAQQKRQRLFRQMTVRLVGGCPRQTHVAGTGSENAARQGRIALVAAACLARQRHQRGNAEDEAQDRPENRDSNCAQKHDAETDEKRGLDAIALPGEHDVAGAIGEPGEAESDSRKDGKKDEDADHDLSHSHDRGLARRAIDSLASACAALSAATRASSARPKSAARALARSGSFVHRSCARATSPRSSAAWICEATAAGSLPGFSPAERTRTRCDALCAMRSKNEPSRG